MKNLLPGIDQLVQELFALLKRHRVQTFAQQLLVHQRELL
jgi:hypothetical protein